MKKIISLFIMLALFVTLAAPGYAKTTEPALPNLKDKKTIQLLKAGAYQFNGVRLGDTNTKLQKQWGKADTTYSVLKRYDGMLVYGADDFSVAYVTGKRGVKPAGYRLESINIMPGDYTFSPNTMRKYWGAYDYTYVQAGMRNYIYGRTILTYVKDGRSWQFAAFGYGNASSIQRVKAAFAE